MESERKMILRIWNLDGMLSGEYGIGLIKCPVSAHEGDNGSSDGALGFSGSGKGEQRFIKSGNCSKNSSSSTWWNF